MSTKILIWGDGVSKQVFEWIGEPGSQPFDLDEFHEWFDDVGDWEYYIHGEYCNCDICE